MAGQFSSLQSSRVRALLAGTFISFTLFTLFSFTNRSVPRPSPFTSGYYPRSGGNDIQNYVTNATLGFEKIYVVNMPQRTDKRDEMVLQAAVSGMKLDFVDGVAIDSISEKVLPIVHEDEYKTTWVAAWRAHMNVLSEIVRLNLTSALIMEDDTDWDVNIKTILRDMAYSTSTLSANIAPAEMRFGALPLVDQPRVSPYGDDWDVLWLGHCGTQISDRLGRVVKFNDRTVAQPHNLHSWDPQEVTPLAMYPNHTRLVGRLSHGTCSLAYAVSQAGARKMLYDMGIRYLDMGFDLMLRAFCTGDKGRSEHKCFGILPPVFEHYRRAGSIAGDSDIHVVNPGTRDQGFTMNIRYSVALNMDKLLAGETDYRDQFPDT